MSERAKVTAKTPEVKRENSVSQKGNSHFSQSVNSPFDHIMLLQRTIGNQAVQRLFKSGVIQAKLKISQPGDKYEQEADRVADAVMCMPEPQVFQHPEKEEEEERIRIKPLAEQVTPLFQRQVEQDEEKEPLRTKESPGKILKVTSDLESRIQAIKGGGQRLSRPARAFFEPRFGWDFSRVRVHTDRDADETARAIRAMAFAMGHHIVFAAGQYGPTTSEGRKLLAHELVHVAQRQTIISRKKGEKETASDKTPEDLEKMIKKELAAPGEPPPLATEIEFEKRVAEDIRVGTIVGKVLSYCDYDVNDALLKLMSLRNKYPNDLYLAAAEHYMFARYFVGEFGQFGFWSVAIMHPTYQSIKDLFYIIGAEEYIPRFGKGVPTPSTPMASRWALKGAEHGLEDYDELDLQRKYEGCLGIINFEFEIVKQVPSEGEMRDMVETCWPFRECLLAEFRWAGGTPDEKEIMEVVKQCSEKTGYPAPSISEKDAYEYLARARSGRS